MRAHSDSFALTPEPRPLSQGNRQFSLSEMFRRPSQTKSLMGAEVWAADDDKCYVPAKVTEALNDGRLVATTADGRKVEAKTFSQRDARDEKEGDLVQMANVDTPNILHTLRHRHSEGSVYTAVGQMGILISINPYAARHTPRALHCQRACAVVHSAACVAVGAATSGSTSTRLR